MMSDRRRSGGFYQKGVSFMLTRRAMLGTFPAAAMAMSLPRPGWAESQDAQVIDAPAPVRQITRGPKHHWFAYYDKLQVDPSGRYALDMEVSFENRNVEPTDVIKIGMIDLHDNDRWTELGTSSAWGWQQGCMLQWLPGSSEEIIWNDRGEDDYISHILNVKTGKKRTLPTAIYCVAPDGKTAYTTDFRRIDDMRPGYGYTGLPDPYADEKEPTESGVWRVDLETGKRELIVSCADVAAVPLPSPDVARFPPGDPADAKHYFNHLLVNPDGTRLVFLHRWWAVYNRRYTRMFTCNPDGSDLRIVVDTGMTSHFDWRDPKHILAWTRVPSGHTGFYVMEDAVDGKMELIDGPGMRQDGHCTYLPDTDWIVNDTYPRGSGRLQELYLVHVPTLRKFSLGHFHLPPEYRGPGNHWRVDLHPRHTPDGKSLIIDSAHTGEGRQQFLVDIRHVVG